MKQFVKKHKERLTLVGLVLAFVLFIGGGLYLQKHSKTARESMTTAAPVSVQLEQPKGQEGQQAKSSSTAVTTYFLKPSPDELLTQLAAMENLNGDVVEAKYANLPVLWPAYFFALRKRKMAGPV